MLNIGVFVSGGGTNLQAMINKIESGYLKDCRITVVIASKPGIMALERAEKHEIKTVCIEKKTFNSINDYDSALVSCLEENDVELVVLAGFMCMLGESFVRKYHNKIINIHPSLIPAFCGAGFYGLVPHQKALEYGVKITGATVHFVEYEYDAGPVILQKAVCVEDDDTPEILQKRVMEQAEWQILPEAVKLFSQGRLAVEGRKVRILPESNIK